VRSDRRALAIAACALLAACGEPTANTDQPAYSPAYVTDGRTVLYHWRAGRTIAVYAQPGSSAGAPQLADALRNAFAAWQRTVEFREFHLTLVDRPADADVIVRFRDDPPLVAFADCTYPGTGASGITFFCPDAALERVQTLPLVGGGGHVKIDVAIAMPGQTAHFQSVVTHEIGHVLGIGAHSLEPADLMYPFPTVDLPSARDVATLRYALHQPSALVL
jgi:predicted Zn-dependent protease